MKENIILLITGLVILLISLAFLLKSKGDKIVRKEEYEKEKETGVSQNNVMYNIENQLMIERIKKLENEVSVLIEKNKEIKNYKNKDEVNHGKSNDFKPILNYSLFKDKNNEIINLYEKGNTNNEIAKLLNKSVREIEMVINLVK